MEDLETWRELITETMESNKDSWANVESCTLTEKQLDVGFESGFGGTRGEPFTVWTKDYVYFPICYDGSEWCGSAPRNPNGHAMEHQGG